MALLQDQDNRCLFLVHALAPVPPETDFHNPPDAAPIKIVPVSTGWTTTHKLLSSDIVLDRLIPTGSDCLIDSKSEDCFGIFRMLFKEFIRWYISFRISSDLCHPLHRFHCAGSAVHAFSLLFSIERIIFLCTLSLGSICFSQ